MPVQSDTIGKRIEWLFNLANRHSAEFRSPEAFLARERYIAEHPTAIVVMKCMDGRINIPVATCTPLGLIQPIRNIGGMFDLGWPHLGEVLASHVARMVAEGRRVLILITYHFSKGDRKRGCAGFDYNTEKAKTHTFSIKRQAEHIFGTRHDTVYPLVCGFETDEDAIVLHGEGGESIDMSVETGQDAALLERKLAAMYPDMAEQVRKDILPLLVGNARHIAKVRESTRLLDIEHREWMICLGRGFDFLHTPNLALIIGPYSPDLSDPVRKGALIIEENMKAGRIPDDGFLLFASVPYMEIGLDRARAELKSMFLSRFAATLIRKEFPGLAAKMHTHTAVLDWRSRSLEKVGDKRR